MPRDATNAGPINVALLGSGGREHALAWRISQSPRLGTLHALPGNPGIAKLARCHKIDPTDPRAVADFCRQNDVGLCVVGPEDPLAAGVADALAKAGVACFGPSKAAAKLEADKAYAKDLMRSAGVPTADSHTFRGGDFEAATQYVRRRGGPLVVKAAGLARGKGVFVCDTEAEAIDAVQNLLRLRTLGDAGATIVIEEKLEGVEVSVLALIDRHDLFVLPPCQDHKPALDGNRGPMTGGMGAFCPSAKVDDALVGQIEREVFLPTLDALAREGIEYCGCLYAGLMLTADGPRVLEFNVRFGDPETQPLLMRWRRDVLAALHATATGGLADLVESGGVAFDDRPAVGVVLASGGYPGPYKTGLPISGLDAAARVEGAQVFHAGTARYGEDLVTDGGRVLTCCALGDDLAAARRRAYEAADHIDFLGKHLRRDIGETA